MTGWRTSLSVVAAGILTVLVGAAFAQGSFAGDSGDSQDRGNYTLPSEAKHFSNMVLHWEQTSFFKDDISPDPANGRTIHGDIWVRFNADGQPDALRGVYTYEDGSFYQDYLYIDQKEALASSAIGDACWVVTDLEPHVFARLVDPDQPIFIRADDMEDTGWILDGTTPGSGVETESPAKPDGSIDIASQLDRWTMTETAGELTKTHVLGVNSDTGRVETESHTIRDGAGNILREDTREQGGIEFFDSESAPVWPFDLNGSSEGCDA